jgi:hypothetical protein
VVGEELDDGVERVWPTEGALPDPADGGEGGEGCADDAHAGIETGAALAREPRDSDGLEQRLSVLDAEVEHRHAGGGLILIM